jgi:hypothetical protein
VVLVVDGLGRMGGDPDLNREFLAALAHLASASTLVVTCRSAVWAEFAEEQASPRQVLHRLALLQLRTMTYLVRLDHLEWDLHDAGYDERAARGHRLGPDRGGRAVRARPSLETAGRPDRGLELRSHPGSHGRGPLPRLGRSSRRARGRARRAPRTGTARRECLAALRTQLSIPDTSAPRSARRWVLQAALRRADRFTVADDLREDPSFSRGPLVDETAFELARTPARC